MNSFDMICMAIGNLWKRKLRTFLTVLGVIIGTASIVVMVSIGIGMNETYRQQIESMGSLQTINVNVPYGGGGMAISMNSSAGSSSGGKKKDVKINKEAIEKFKQIEGVETATPVLNSYLTLINGKNVCDTSVKGIYLDSMESLGYKIAEGRNLTTEDEFGIVVGKYILENFRNPKLSWQARWNSPPAEVDLFGDTKTKITYDNSYGTKNADKKVKPYKIEPVGVLDGDGENSYSAFMSLQYLEKILGDQQKSQSSNSGNKEKKKKGEYDQAIVKVDDIDNVKVVMEQLKEMGYECYSLTEYLESTQETSKMMQMVLGAIGAVSLLVAAIGITNTMIMSIYERTREIGVMKVIGASLGDIQRLFLTEAAFIGFTGGLFGLGLSYLLSKIINIVFMGQFQSSIPAWLALSALIFSTIVGIVAGFFPARRAMSLSALSAIKTE